MTVMKHLPITTRRVAAVAAAVVAGLAISTAAYAATSSGTARTAAAAIPKCTAFDIGAWVAAGQGNGAAGTIYYPLEFTNLSHHTCSLFGYPGVSVLDRNGRQLGSPAGWGSRAGARTVNLAPGATAHTILAYHDAAVSTSPGCDPVYTAAQLRIYPPDQYSATYAFFSLESCSRPGVVYLDITEPIIPGVGTVYG
jgi:Protein of unknown function (DUF4232)